MCGRSSPKKCNYIKKELYYDYKITDIIKEIRKALDPNDGGMSMIDQRTFRKLVSQAMEGVICEHNFDRHIDDGEPEIVADDEVSVNGTIIREYEILTCNKCHDKKRFFRKEYNRENSL